MYSRRLRTTGFTLIELIIVIAIIGILALVAVPQFMKLLKRSKTNEATTKLRDLYDASVTYYEAEHADKDGKILPKQFPPSSNGPVPAPVGGACHKFPGDKWQPDPTRFLGETWTALNFHMDDPFYYSYQYESSGADKDAKFKVSAFGDLDCNGTFSSFVRSGTVLPDGHVSSSPPVITNELE